MRGACALTGALLGMLTGCMPGPRYTRPEVTVPAAYAERPAEGWAQASPQDAIPRGAWWRVFEDAELDRLEERVAVSNQTLVQAVKALDVARQEIAVARASEFPSLQAGITPGRSLTSQNLLYRGVAGKTVSNFNVGAGASWEPDLFGKYRHAVDAAQARAEASAADLASVELGVRAELALDYFDLRGVDSATRLLIDTVAAYQEAFDITERRYHVGVSSESDVALARTVLDQGRAQLIDLGVSRAQLEHAIATLVGEPASTFRLAPSADLVKPPALPAGVPSSLLERRPDIASAERQVAAANADVGSATSAFFPDLMISLTGGLEASLFDQWAALPSRFWGASMPLLGTVFDGGRRKALLHEANARYESAIAAYRQTVLRSFQDVEDQLAALRVLGEEAEAERTATDSARHDLDLAMSRYKAGAADYLEVTTAEGLALGAQRASIDISRRRLDADVLLVKALGGTWQSDQYRVSTGASNE